MLTKQDIVVFFSKAYEQEALREGVDMRLVSDLLETIRSQVNENDPYDWWDFILLDHVKFDNDVCLEILRDLKEYYYNFYFEKLMAHLDVVYSQNKEDGLKLWYALYGEAAVHFKEDLLCMLSYKRSKWGRVNKSVAKYAKLSRLIQESRWPDAFSYYVEIADNKALADEVRAYAAITLAQIILYHYPETSKAQHYIEKATALLPDHFLVKRAWAEYYFKTGDPERARTNFLQVIAMKPGDYLSFNYIADTLVTEAKLEYAESWYEDGLQKNFLQTDSYARLINLYGNKIWIKEKEVLIPPLLEKIAKRNRFLNSRNLVEKNMATADCFKDSALYQSYRDVGAAYYGNDEIARSEEWYQKARSLHPSFSAAIIDIAYLEIHQGAYDKAQQYFTEAIQLDKDNFDVYRGLAYLYEKQNDKDAAIKAYQHCLILRPEWSDWVNNFIGNIYYTSGEYAIAASYYRKAIKANENYNVYRQNLADALREQAIQLQDTDKKEAEKLYLAAAKLDNDALRWNLLGNFYYKNGRFNDALKNYGKAIELQPEEAVYYENRGLAFESLGKMTEAEQSYKAALDYDNKTGRYFNRLGFFYFEQKKYEPAIDYYLKALERNPAEPIYLENICIAYEQMNQQDKAEPYYLRLIEINPANDRIQNLLGIVYYKRKDYANAEKYYLNAIKQDNRIAVYHENLAILYRSMQKLQEALAAFEAAIQLDPANEINWNDAGVLHFKLGNYEKAIEYYGKAIEINPTASLYYENIASAFEAKQEIEKAAINYNKALEIKPDNARVLNAMGVIHYRKQSYETAVNFYKKAVELEKDNWIYQTNLAQSLRFLRRNEEAVVVLRTALDLHPGDYLNWNDLGVLLYEKGEAEAAAECYNKSIDLQPGDAVLYVNLALALNEQGKITEAQNIISDHRLPNELKQKVEDLLLQYLPLLYEVKN